MRRAAVAAGAPAPAAARGGWGVARAAAKVEAPAAPEKGNYAVIEVAGHQTIVKEGALYSANRLNGTEPGDAVEFRRVLLAKDQDAGTLHVGKPYVEGAVVRGEVVEHYKGKKVLVQKYKPKKHYKRLTGHRQHLTKFRITEIEM